MVIIIIIIIVALSSSHAVRTYSYKQYNLGSERPKETTRLSESGDGWRRDRQNDYRNIQCNMCGGELELDRFDRELLWSPIVFGVGWSAMMFIT